MRFEGESGAKYRIRFEYGRRLTRRAKKPRRLTSCLIEQAHWKGAARATWVVVSQGETECSRKDQFVRETGRKIALERALWGWSQPSRARAWAAYRNRRGVALSPDLDGRGS